MKVKNMLTLFCTWLVKCNEEGVSHRELGAYRRDLLKDYFSPWCRNEQALSKGATLQDRLDVMAAQIGYVTPVVVKESKRTEEFKIDEASGMEIDGDSNLAKSNLEDLEGWPPLDSTPEYTVERKDRASARREASEKAWIVGDTPFLGVEDSRPFPVWFQKFKTMAVSRGLLLDPPALYFTFVNNLAESVVVDIKPELPTGTSSLDRIREVRRMVATLRGLCKGISTSVCRLQALQELQSCRQGGRESVSAFVRRFKELVGNVEAFGKEHLDDESKATSFLCGLLPEVRDVALDRLAGQKPTYAALVSSLTQREKMRSVVTSSTSRPTSLHRVEESGGQEESQQGSQQERPQKGICYQFKREGRCRFGAKCRLRHEASEERNGSVGTVSFTQDLYYVATEADLKKSGGNPGSVMTITGKNSNDENVTISVLLDTGAYHNYIREPYAKMLSLKVDLVPANKVEQVRLADHSVVSLVGTAELGMYNFKVLPSSSPVIGNANGEFGILGVYSLCTDNVQLQFSFDGTKRKVNVATSSPSCMPPNGLLTPLEGSMDTIGNILGPVVSDMDIRDGQVLKTSSDVWSDVAWKPVIAPEVITSSSWKSLRDSPGYRWCVQPLGVKDPKDTVNQKYKIIIDLPYENGESAISSSRFYDYTPGLFSRLTDSESAAYKAEVSNYLRNSWWTKTDDDDGEKGTGGVGCGLLVFPLPSPGRSTSCRPVVDARRENSRLPSASYAGATCGQIVASLRLSWNASSSPRIITLDAKQAFYRLYTSRELMIRSHNLMYRTPRLIFGLACGPSMLLTAISEVILPVALFLLTPTDRNTVLSCCRVYIYLDDLTLYGWGEGYRVLPCLAQAIREAGSLYGFLFPRGKSVDSVESGGAEFKHLGLFWSVKNSVLSNRCNKSAFSEGLLSKPTWTKRELFAAAGHASIGNDVALQHPKLRALGDILRRVAGSKQSSWDSPLQLTCREDQVVRDCLRRLLNLLRAPCEHSVSPLGAPDTLVCCSDASLCGGGWCVQAKITDGASFTSSGSTGSESWELAASSTAWKGAQLNYHINRLELVALSRLVLWLVDNLGAKPPPTLKLIIFNCDSSVVLNWVRRGRTSTKTTERLSVKRMLNNINELLCALGDSGITISYKKIEGALNERADELSRLVQQFGFDDMFGLNIEKTGIIAAVTAQQHCEIEKVGAPEISPEERQRYMVAQREKGQRDISHVIAENEDTQRPPKFTFERVSSIRDESNFNTHIT